MKNIIEEIKSYIKNNKDNIGKPLIIGFIIGIIGIIGIVIFYKYIPFILSAALLYLIYQIDKPNKIKAKQITTFSMSQSIPLFLNIILNDLSINGILPFKNIDVNEIPEARFLPIKETPNSVEIGIILSNKEAHEIIDYDIASLTIMARDAIYKEIVLKGKGFPEFSLNLVDLYKYNESSIALTFSFSDVDPIDITDQHNKFLDDNNLNDDDNPNDSDF